MENNTKYVIEILAAIAAWIVVGAANDLIKLLLKTFGGYVRFLPNMLAKTSKKANRAIKSHIDNDTQYEIASQFVISIKTFFGNVKLSLQAWAKHFQAQVTEESDKKENNIDEVQENTDTIQSPIGVEKPETKYSGQKIIGAFIELIALLAFLYADAAQAAQTFSVLFPMAKIPAFLDDIVIPLIISSAGTAFILGIFLGDMLGLTHLSFWGRLRGWKKIAITTLMILNLLASISLSTLVALYRADVISPGEHSQLIFSLARNAQSLIIAPMLITTALLLRGVFGLFIVISVVLYFASLPFAFFEYFTDIFSKLVAAGAISIDYVFSRLLWLITGAFELVFSLLKFIVEGSFLSLIIIWTLIFYIPYIVVNGLIKRFTDKTLIDYFQDLDGFKLILPPEPYEKDGNADDEDGEPKLLTT